VTARVVLAAVAAAATVVAVVFAALYFGNPEQKTVTKTVVVQPCGDRTFGHIKSLTRSGDHFVLEFDPAWFLSGSTANTAAAQDGVVPAGQPVPNDNYVVEEGHRLLRYLVPATAHATVLTSRRTPTLSTPVSVSELATIVANGKSSRITLYEPLESGVWIRVHNDTVCALDQQYRP